MINLGIFAYIGTANAETEITAEYLNSVTQFNDRVVWEDATAAGGNTVQIGDKFYKYTYTKPSDYTNASERLTDANITQGAVTDKVFAGFTGEKGGAIYNSTDNGNINITSDFLHNKSASDTTIDHIANAIYNSSKLGDVSGVFIDNSVTETTTGGSIDGGVIFNVNASMGNITGDFIGNDILGNGQTSGGIILNEYGNSRNSAIKNISASFIGNEVKAGPSQPLLGGLIHNAGSTIDEISADFIGNSIQQGNKSNGVLGGLINNHGANGWIEKISGNFLYNKVDYGNENTSAVLGGLLYNGATYNGIGEPPGSASMGDLTGNFEHNEVLGSTIFMYGGLVSNFQGTMGNVTGDFTNNVVTTTSDILGGFIFNAYSTIGNMSGNFKGNKLTGKTVYGIYNLSSQMGDISGNFEGNELTGEKTVYGIYNRTSQIGVISGDFINNTYQGNIVYGGIFNSGGTINQIVGSTFQNNVANGSATAIGAGITNLSTITNGIVNAKFLDNIALSDTDAAGVAIYTTKSLNITADGSIGDGISTFKGNYYQIAGGEKKYEAIYMGSAANTLTLAAKNGGTINMYDYIDGSSGYTTTVTGDSSGTLNLYNDIKSSNVSIEKVNVSTADGTLHDYSLLSLNSDAAVKWKIDFDVKDAASDTFETAVPAAATDTEPAGTASAGTVTLDKLNLTNGDYSDVSGADFKVQILKTQGTTSAAALQLALTDELKAELEKGYVVSKEEDVHVDEVTADTKWSDEFKKVGTIITKTDKLGLATTDTLNDSIGVISEETTEEPVDEKLGDTLAMVNQAELSDKNFTADKADEVYKAEDDLGTTYGNVTINGMASGDKKSTVDLDGHNGFVIGDGASVALNNARLTDSAGKAAIEIADGGKMSLQNSELSGVDLKVNGEFDAAENEVSAKKATFGKNSTLKLLVNNIKDDHGAFKADSFDIAQGATLDVTFGQNPLGDEKTGEVALLSLNNGSDIDNNNFSDEFHNNMYKFVRKSEKSGIYGVYQTKTAEEISRESGGTKTNQDAAAAWVDGPSFAGGMAAKIADGLADLAQNNGASFNEALTALAPNDDGMVQAVSADINDRLLLTIDNHLVEASKEEGLSSGDNGKNRGYPDLSGVKTWIKAYYGEAKLQRRGDIYGFNSDSRGFIAGVDKKVASTVKAGIGMQYDDTDIDAFERDGDAKTLLGFVYGEYRPSNWFVNAALAYGVTDYDEDKTVVGQKVAAHYKAEMYSLQGLAGYTFKYFTPEIGARYYQIRRHGYTDSALQSVSGNNMDLLRATAGVKAETTYGMFKPHAYVGILYDLVSDRDTAIVNLTNGAGYTVHGKRLPRFGVEIGAGVSANLNDHIELGLGYEAKFRKDYQDHSGIINFKYNF